MSYPMKLQRSQKEQNQKMCPKVHKSPQGSAGEGFPEPSSKSKQSVQQAMKLESDYLSSSSSSSSDSDSSDEKKVYLKEEMKELPPPPPRKHRKH